MPWPPTLPPGGRADATVMAAAHPSDHNLTAGALASLVGILGNCRQVKYTGTTPSGIAVSVDVGALLPVAYETGFCVVLLQTMVSSGALLNGVIHNPYTNRYTQPSPPAGSGWSTTTGPGITIAANAWAPVPNTWMVSPVNAGQRPDVFERVQWTNTAGVNIQGFALALYLPGTWANP